MQLAPRTTRSEYIKIFNEIHNSAYDYSLLHDEIYSNSIIEIICPLHGIFKSTASDHKRSISRKPSRCMQCFPNTKRLLENDVINLFNSLHNYKYSYKNFKYSTKHIKSYVTCPIHGDWLISANNHLKGKGCKKCSSILPINRKPCYEGQEVILYVIRCFNDTESFLKLGLSKVGIKRRYTAKSHMPYNYEILLDLKIEGAKGFDLELKLKKEFVNQRYTPNIKFGGSKTECFNISISKQLIAILSQSCSASTSPDNC